VPHVVTRLLRHDAEILLTRRSDAVGTYQGRWAGVSGYVEGDPADALDDARREIREEIGRTDARLVRRGPPLDVVDGDREWTVHPFLFSLSDRAIDPNEELAATEWAPPTAMLRRETVPGLWIAYRRVGPTVETIRTDADHGAATLSIRALEVLRDVSGAVAAGTADAAADGDTLAEGDETIEGDAPAEGDATDGWRRVRQIARDLRAVRPGMAAVIVRIDAAMAGSDGPAAVHEAALDGIESALRAADAAAAAGAERLADDAVVATLSRSGTVEATLDLAAPSVIAGESRPAREGVGVAERLAASGLDVTLTTDAALPALVACAPASADDDASDGGADSDPDGHATTTPADLGLDATGLPPGFDGIDAVLVGADAVLADGRVVNKTGTRAVSVAAARAGVPVYVVATRAKVRPDRTVHGEATDPASVYDGEAALRVASPRFDVTPADCVTTVLTEDGPLDRDAIRRVAAEHRARAAWVDAVD